MNSVDNDSIPIVGHYRGVGLHDQQSEERLNVVRRAIDDVYDLQDHQSLSDIAGDPFWPPEARLFAAAKLQATHELAAQDRERRPPIDLVLVAALVAGLDSQRWRDPQHYTCLLDVPPVPGVVWPKREQPLDADNATT